MFPLQLIDGAGLGVLVYSLLALLAFVVVGGAVTQNAKSHNTNNPTAWGVAVFVALLVGTLVAGVSGAAVAGVLVIGLYVVVRE
ncbi:hypothetical protein [Natrononativus amylolyticus]|uniref:hypothetical protein n=1 Tax=Natrononativus amylolyticus TaxID=2963434 RepID=UPI0020CBB6B5|nr:hypothetical protein [Natrononativus amylolyticus]